MKSLVGMYTSQATEARETRKAVRYAEDSSLKRIGNGKASVLLAASLAVATLGTSANASTLVIDDFADGTIKLGRTTSGWTPVTPSTSVTISESGLAVLGGQRDTTLTKVGGSDISPYVSLNTVSTTVSFNSGFGDQGSSMAFAYGVGGDLNLDLTGFAGFGLLGLNGDQDQTGPLNLNIALTTTGFGSSSAGTSLQADGDYFVPFTSFVGSAVLGDIDAVSFQLINPNAADYQIDAFVAAQAVPLPAAAWLFGSAILGAGFLGRRKKSATASTYP